MEWLFSGLSLFGGAFFGAIVGIVVEKAWTKIESIPRFRVHVGFAHGIEGDRITLSIENAGAVEIPEYTVMISRNETGSLNAAAGNEKMIFPQFPSQKNHFMWYTNSPKDPSLKDHVKEWFHRVGYERSELPLLDGYELTIKQANSERVLFISSKVGEYLAHVIYFHASGDARNPKAGYFYDSNALWWDEWLHRRRGKKELDAVLKRIEASRKTQEKSGEQSQQQPA